MQSEFLRNWLKKHTSLEQRNHLKALALRHRFINRFLGSDLVTLAILHQTDKWRPHDYAMHYQQHFQPLRHLPLNLLEIGVGGYDDPTQGGNSLRMWKNYFPRANIYAIDLHDKSALQEPRIRIFQGSQADPDFLKRVAGEIGRLDIIIDDGSHINEHVISTFQILFPLLAENGIYAMEDLGTAYVPRLGGSLDLNCQTTSIAMCKRLIDGLNWRKIPDYQATYFDRHIIALHYYTTLAVIYKGVNEPRSMTSA